MQSRTDKKNSNNTVTFKIITFQVQKHFKTVTEFGNFNSNAFQDVLSAGAKARFIGIRIPDTSHPKTRKRQFVHNMLVHNFGAPLHPLLTSKVMDFLLNFY